MNKKKYQTINTNSLLVIVLLFVFKSNAQQTCPSSLNEWQWPTHTNWFSGKAQMINFGSGGTGGVSNSTFSGPDSPFTSYESAASASDEDGNLVIFTNGVKLWDGNGNEVTIPSGRLLTGAESVSGGTGSAVQGVFITKHPLNDNDYYIFTTDDAIGGINGITNGFNYFIYDKKNNTCSGANRLGNYRSTEQVSGTFHHNGIDIWIVTHETAINGTSKNYNAYLLECNGLVTNPVVSTLGFNVRSNTVYNDWQGNPQNSSEFSNERSSIRFQSNGSLNKTIKAAATFHCGQGTWDPVKSVSLLDFDCSTGLFSNNVGLGDGLVPSSNPYDCEFSADGSKLYVSFQADPWSGPLFGRLGYYTVPGGVYTQLGSTGDGDYTVGAVRLGGDGNIYAAKFKSNGWAYQDDFITSNGSNMSLTGLAAGSKTVGYGLPNMFVPPQDWVEIQDPGVLTECDLPVDLSTLWKCKGSTAEKTPQYEIAYSVKPGEGSTINDTTGLFNATSNGTYTVYFELCSIKDSLTFSIGTCGCDVELGVTPAICLGETVALDPLVIKNSGTGTWIIDSVPSNYGVDATINNSGSDTLFDASVANTKYGTYKLKYKIGDNRDPNCLEFNGINSYVSMGDVNDLGTSDFTIESWIYINNNSASGNGNKIINKGLTSVGVPSNAGYGLRASKTGLDEIEFQIGNFDGNTKRVVYNGVTINEWYHVAGVRSGKKLYLYLNGILVAEDSTTTIYDVNTNIPLTIGALHKGGLSSINEFMDGKIDEVRIWDAAKSSFEINRSKDCAVISQEPNLVASYNLDETTGNTASDASSNANNGSLINGPTWVSSSVAHTCNECEDSIYIEVRKIPTVVIDSIGPFCDDSVAVVMTAIPLNGGDVTGMWKINNGTSSVVPNFDPISLGAGFHEVAYIIDSLGCQSSDTIKVFVKERTKPKIDQVGPYCADDPEVTLTMTPIAGDTGVWSKSADTLGKFIPSNVGAGDHFVFYTIGGMCGATDTIQIHVDAVKNGTINTPSDTMSYCVLDPNPKFTVNEVGGVWDNASVIQTGLNIEINLDLNTGGLGLVTNKRIIYTIGGPCGDADTIWVTTTNKLDATITQVGPYCDSDGPITLSVKDAGGSFSGIGIDAVTGVFTPKTAGVGIHTITYTITGNCGDVQTIDIEVLRTSDPTITNTAFDFCEDKGNELLTVAEAGGIWREITPVSGGFTAGTSTFNTIDAGDGLFKIEYGFGGQCPALDTITLNITALPVITITGQDTLCVDDAAVQIIASATPSTSTTWAGAVSSLGMFDPIGKLGDNKMFFEALNGICQAKDSLSVYVLPREDASIDPITKQCVLSAPVMLVSTSGNSKGIWLGNGITAGFFDPSKAGVGTHTITHTINGRCSDTETIDIEVVGPPDPTIITPSVVCAGSEIVAFNAITPGGIWSGDVVNGEFNPILGGTFKAIYTITGICTVADTVLFVVNTTPKTDFSVAPRSGCVPLIVTFNDLSDEIPNSSIWDFGNIGTSNALATEVVTFNEDGCYDVTLSNAYSNGCKGSKKTVNAVCAYEIPDVDFDWNPNPANVDNSIITFNNLSSYDVVSNTWDFTSVVLPSNSVPITIASPTTSNAVNPIVNFTSSNGDTINVCLEVVNQNGCVNDTCKLVTIMDKFSVIIPNAFTPNGDGVNDTFFPKGRNLSFGKNYEFSIYNRWGSLIWISKTPGEGWDGTVTEMAPTSGEIAQIDVYVWRLVVNDPFTGDKHESVGHVSLVK